MIVRVNSAMAVKARADILEFELVNHPLDCPVCDKGGECPLQDFTFRHGYPRQPGDWTRASTSTSRCRSAPNIALDRERCVLCYRCTRYYDEIAWEQELTSRPARRRVLHRHPVRRAADQSSSAATSSTSAPSAP